MMEKTIINVGDIYFTRMNALRGLLLKNLLTVEYLSGVDKEFNEYLYKTIAPLQIRNVKEIDDFSEKMYYCPIVIKYIGEGKFEEMETGTIILCEGSNRMKQHELVDEDSIKFRANRAYESYKELISDISYVRENPISLYNDRECTMKPISEISENDKIAYTNYSKEDRVETIRRIKKSTTCEFDKSVKKSANYDYKIANFENEIESFKSKKI